MTQIKETVGRLPIYIGEYDSNKTYKKKNRVTLFGSEFQSLIDNNTYAPATLSADETHIIFDEVHWKVISNGSDAFLNHQTVLEKLDEIDSKQNSMQSEINGKQLEIGAVQTDVVPTQGSANHMTSGAIYETLKNPASGFVKNTTPEEEGDKLVNEALVAGMYGFYTENPEWIWVVLDSQEHVLGGFKTDGSFEFNAGVPTPIREYIAAQLESFVTEISNKVDKEDGKGLIIVDFANSVSYEENPEWVFVQLDAEGKVLSGIRNDGTNFISRLEVGEFVDLDKLIAKFGNSYYNVSLNHTELESKVYYHPQTGWKQVGYDSSASPYDEADTYNIGEVCNVEGDIEHSYESTARQQGNYPAYTTVALHVKERLDLAQALEKIPSDVLSGFVAGQVITFVDNDDIVEKWELQNDETWSQINPSVINDIEERLSIELDREDKILSYRKKDGTLVENVGVETPLVNTDNLNLTEKGMTDFQRALKESGFIPGGCGNLSDKDYIDIPKPKKYGMLNFILDGDFPAWYHNSKIGEFEYYDYNGNYFKKPCTITTQGQTSIQFALNKGKGNYTLDIEDGSDVKFGDWVPQDSFHLKGCAKDVTKGYLATSYKWAYMMMEHLNAKPNRQLSKEDNINTTQSSGDFFSDWGDGARCIPDGFPVEVYLNGTYWGMYALQLKKHRKNYSMDKKDYTSCFIDPDHYMPSIGTPGGFWEGEFWWDRFEIRGPKDLICMDGSEYDGDSPKELIDETSEVYDSSNKKHKGSAQTKRIIESFSTKYLEVKALVEQNTVESLAQAKELFAEYFDVNACILVYVFNSLMRNSDSIIKNTLWGIWKNGKIAPLLWDLDGVYGEGWIGTYAAGPDAYVWDYYKAPNWPLALLGKLYFDEIKEAYYNLRRSGIISIDTWREVIYGWVNSIGVDAYQRDLKKWPETPSYRADLTNMEYWKYGSGECDEWDEQRAYSRGEKAWLNRALPNQAVDRVVYEAVQDVPAGVCPVTEFYERFPRVGGFYDSPKRMEKWMTRQIELCDQLLNYSDN